MKHARDFSGSQQCELWLDIFVSFGDNLLMFLLVIRCMSLSLLFRFQLKRVDQFDDSWLCFFSLAELTDSCYPDDSCIRFNGRSSSDSDWSPTISKTLGVSTTPIFTTHAVDGSDIRHPVEVGS